MIVGKLSGNIWATRDKVGPSQRIERPIYAEELDMPVDIVRDLMGDRAARVTVSKDMKDSDFGTGFGAFVTVTLTCDQSEDGLRDGFVVADGLSNEFVEQAFKSAHQVFEGLH